MFVLQTGFLQTTNQELKKLRVLAGYQPMPMLQPVQSSTKIIYTPLKTNMTG